MARNDICTEFLRYEFRPMEIKEMGQELANQYNRLRQIEEEETAMKAQIKDRKATCDQAIGKLSRLIGAQFEMRNVECVILWHTPAVGFCTIVRKDTGELVKERIMTHEERKELLPFPDRMSREIPKVELVAGILAELGEEFGLDVVSKWSDTDLILVLEWAQALKKMAKDAETQDPNALAEAPKIPAKPRILFETPKDEDLAILLKSIGMVAPEVLPEGFRGIPTWSHHERWDVVEWASAVDRNSHLADGQEAEQIPARPEILATWKRTDPPAPPEVADGAGA